jgi:acetyl esterase/lipase
LENLKLNRFTLWRLALKSLTALLIACALCCWAIAAEAAQKAEIIRDVAYDHQDALQTLDVVKPQNANGAGILCIVSGAWHSCKQPPEATLVADASYPYFGWFECRALLDKGFTLFLVRHRSGEKHLLPEIVDDVHRSVRFIRHNAKRFVVDPDRLGVTGCSSGGHLTLMLATTGDDGDPQAKDALLRTSDRVAVAVAYMPPADLRPWFQTSRYKDWEALRFAPAMAGAYSPVTMVSPKTAPTLLIHGDKDFGVPMVLSEKMLAECREQHVPCELLVIKNAGHGFAGKDRKQAEAARDAWFEKYLLPAKGQGVTTRP